MGLDYKTVILFANVSNVGGIQMKGLERVWAHELYILPSECLVLKINGTFLSLNLQIAAGYHGEITTEAISTGSSSNNKWHAMHVRNDDVSFCCHLQK